MNIEVLIILSLLWVLWLTSSRRWRQRLIQPITVLLIGYWLVVSPAMVGLATWGITRSLPSDPGGRVDAIVVLGRGRTLRDQRVAVAGELWQAQRAPRIFASGMLDARPIVQQLREIGVPKPSLAGEECSQSTEENGLFTSVFLRPQGVRTILLVTDAPHMRRSLLVFQSFGFEVIPYISPLHPHSTVRDQFAMVVREYVGLAAYAVTGNFRKRSPTELDRPPTAIVQRISDWGCRA